MPPQPKEYQLRFIEYQTHKSENWNPETHSAGRIEIYEIGGDIEKDKEEIEARLPSEIWQKLRKALDGYEF